MYPNPAASREISTLSLHDALPISARCVWGSRRLLDLVALVGTGGLGKSRHQEISRDPPDAGRARVHSCRLGLKNRRQPVVFGDLGGCSTLSRSLGQVGWERVGTKKYPEIHPTREGHEFTRAGWG